MTIIQALVLGIIQGLTEFIPISSSGHLVLFPKILGWGSQPLAFDTTLHLATSLALIVFFWKDLVLITKGFLGSFSKHKFSFNSYTKSGKLALFILIGSIPAAIFGYLFEGYIETVFRSLTSVAVFLLIGSVLMFFAEKDGTKAKEHVNFGKSFVIGLFQALSLFPGFSRSGATISGGMIFGLRREEAARFSFLLAIPIIVGAAVYQLFTSPNLLLEVSVEALTTGFISSFVFGLFAIRFLLKFLKTNTLYSFIAYRVILSIILFYISNF